MADILPFDVVPAPKAQRQPDASPQVREWREGLLKLTEAKDPCMGFRSGEWAKVLAAMHAFLDRFGEEAVQLGWSTSDLFAVHPTAGILRLDGCGALVSRPEVPDAITADTITFGKLTWRDKPGRVPGPPIWEFVMPAAKAKPRGL